MTALVEENGLGELAAALALFQAEVPVVAKGKTAKIETQGGRSYSYSYADLADVAQVVMPLLAKHGLAFLALPTGQAEGPPMLVGMLVHKSGQRVTGELPISGRTPQEIGSSLTYGRRYLLGCLTGVVTDDDDDGALAERSAKLRKAQPARPSAEDLPVAPPPIQRRPRATEPVREEPPTGLPGPEPDNQSTGSRRPAAPSARVAMFAAMAEVLGTADRAERLALSEAIVGHRIESSTELTPAEVGRILTWLEDAKAGRVSWVYAPDQGVALVQVTQEPPGEDLL